MTNSAALPRKRTTFVVQHYTTLVLIALEENNGPGHSNYPHDHGHPDDPGNPDHPPDPVILKPVGKPGKHFFIVLLALEEEKNGLQALPQDPEVDEELGRCGVA